MALPLQFVQTVRASSLPEHRWFNYDCNQIFCERKKKRGKEKEERIGSDLSMNSS